MDVEIYLNRDNFGGFNDDELLKIQSIIEELNLNERLISEEWESFALSKKISEEFSKHLDPFKAYLKKNMKKIMEKKAKAQAKDAVPEDDPKIFEDQEIGDIIFDDNNNNDNDQMMMMNNIDENTNTNNVNNNNNVNNIKKSNMKSFVGPSVPSKTTAAATANANTNTTAASKIPKNNIIIEDIGDVDFSDLTTKLPSKSNPFQQQQVPIISYKDRLNIGKSINSFGIKENKVESINKEKKTIELKAAGEEFYPIKYNSDTLEQRTKILKDSVTTFINGDNTIQQAPAQFPVSLQVDELKSEEEETTTSTVRSIGRVWMYDQETLLSKRFYLLGDYQQQQQQASGISSSSTTTTSTNNSTSVYSLESNIKEYSMFPGQIIMTESKKIAGSNFYYTNKVYYPLALPFFDQRKESGDINIMVASGPFDLNKSIPDYTPLDDLCSVVTDRKPHILLLMGPFIDDTNIHISKYSETFSELFNLLLKKLNDKIPSTTKVLIVPSLKDVDHDYILPQPPYNPTINLNSNILFVPNPFTLIVNESFSVGITSTDIYNHLESKSHFKDNTHKPEDIFNMLINQHSYYPMHPAQAPVSMRYLQHLNFPGFTPDILIVNKSSSSNSNSNNQISDNNSPIVTVSNDVLCLGVTPIVSNKSFGSYAEITVTKSNQNSFTNNNIPVSKRTTVNFKNI